MKLSFERYIETAELTKESIGLYKESIICYKAGAYRASLIMTYLAFLESIKNKIIISEKPDDVLDGEWQKIKKKISKEDEWDKGTFEVLTQEDFQIPNGSKIIKKKVFDISSSLKRELEYWRDRRNDCAHYKKNQITSSHIESFWSFIISNYKKIDIYGSRETLLKNLSKYLELNVRIDDQRVKEILKQISQGIRSENEAEEVILAVEHLLENKYSYSFMYESDVSELLHFLLDLEEENIKKGVEKYLNSKESIVFFLEKNTQNLIKLNLSDSLIMKIWKQELNLISNHKLCDLVSVLLNNDFVIESDKIEFKKEIARRLIQSELSEIEFKILMDNGIIDVFLNERIYGISYNFNIWNMHNNFIFCILEKTQSLDLLKKILEVSKKAYPPHNTKATLIEKLEDTEWKQSMIKIYEEAGENPDPLFE